LKARSERTDRNSTDSTRELAILEQPLTPDSAEYRTNRHQLNSAPIVPAWILEGSPAARGKILSGSTDGKASTYMWDCTAGRFNWSYGCDETICVLEGFAILTDSTGVRHFARPGDTFFFPAGSRFEWSVPSYVRKIAFLHVPMSRKMQFLQRIFKVLTRLAPARSSKIESTTSLTTPENSRDLQ
jgi:uncharacterized cupin superfamily protein